MRFAPSLIPTLATVVTLPCLLLLGFWQLDRAAQKRELYAAFQERNAQEPCELGVDCPRPDPPEALAGRRVHLTDGRTPGPSILLDNHVMRGRAGYLVLEPRTVSGEGRVLLVARGWIPWGESRAQAPSLPTAPLPERVSGVLANPPAAGIRLGRDTSVETLAPGLVRIGRMDFARLESLYGKPLLPLLLQLDMPRDDGYVRDWSVPGAGDDRHTAYAVQWFSMAAIVAFLYIWLNLRRGDRRGARE